MFTHSITRKWESGSAALTKKESLDGSGEVNIDQAVDASEADLLISYSILMDQLKSFYMVSTKDMVVTPHNQSDSPMAQIDLAAGIPFLWTSTSGLDNPFADDIGSLHVENLAASEGTLSIRTLIDASPETSS